MNWTSIVSTITTFLEGFLDANKSPTPPPPAATNAPAKQGANAAIAALQEFLNQLAQMGFLQLAGKLRVDGWIGPKTEAAIMTAIARLKSLIGAP